MAQAAVKVLISCSSGDITRLSQPVSSEDGKPQLKLLQTAILALQTQVNEMLTKAVQNEKGNQSTSNSKNGTTGDTDEEEGDEDDEDEEPSPKKVKTGT